MIELKNETDFISDFKLNEKDRTFLILYKKYIKNKTYVKVFKMAHDYHTELIQLLCFFEPNILSYCGKTIPSYAFAHCNNLASVSIPDNITGIGERAFKSCENLTSITIPESVVRIGYDAFKGSYNLIIKCKKGSYADKYAQKHDIKVEYI